jgi:Asp-tRNA(Asn)/Glu-tRNA(Gln) amidotransferase A subunit family amidase
MVLLGKANTVQFAFGAPGVNHHHGTPHNPWHTTPHVPGVGNGSGGGGAGLGHGWGRYGGVRGFPRRCVAPWA